MKNVLMLIVSVIISVNVFAQGDSYTNLSSVAKPKSYEVKQALEVESLVPMFITGGYHFALGYRYHKFRFRASVINGGSYDAEKAGFNNSSDEFKRFYKTSPGFFAGYNVWKNLEVYAFLECHRFGIEQKSTGVEKTMRSFDYGGGVGYQFFIGRYFYIQPAVHLYLRKEKTLDFEDVTYKVPTADFSPVLRLGFRYWSK